MKRRLIAAFLLAPWVTSAVFAGALSPDARSFGGVLIVFILYAAFAYVAEVILGLPAFLIYRRLRWGGFISHGLGGVALGLLAASSVAVIYSPFTRMAPGEFVLCMAAGAASGLTFRFIAGEYSRERRAAIGTEI
jgi:hypothetical protein